MSDTDTLSLEQTLAAFDVPLDGAPRSTIAAAASHRDMVSLPAMQLLEPGAPADAHTRSDALLLADALGVGGMGVVHLARQPSLDREVAVKTLHEPDPVLARQLVYEARITGRLEHPNVVPVHALGVDPERGPLVVMKRVQGQSWEALLLEDAYERVETSNDTALLRHLEILMQVCNAVHFAHSRGIIHRDLKPANVMVGEFGEVYLMDWGVALDLARREHEPNAIVGTASYMAPEMVSGDPCQVDARTDVFLLGAMLHEVITGQPRHDAPGLVGAFVQAQKAEPASYPQRVPPALAAIANRACHRDPASRYRDAAAFRQALVEYLDLRTVHALVAATEQRLIELEQAVESSGTPAATGRARADHDSHVTGLYEQLRFALEQLQEAAPALESQALLRQRALNAMLGHELTRENLLGARRLVRELDDHADAALRARFDTLERAERERRERLAARQAAFDPSVARRQRSLIAGGVAVLAVGVTIQGTFRRGGATEATPQRLMLIGFGLVSIVVVGGLIWRHKIRANDINRRFYRTLFTLIVGVACNRFIGVVSGHETPDILQADLLIIGAALLTAPLRSWLAVTVGAAAVLIALLSAGTPAYVLHGFRVYSILGSIVLCYVYVRGPRNEPP